MAKNETFDPDAFLQQTIDQPMETERELVPEGEYPAMIGDFESKALEMVDFTYKKGDRAGQPGSMLKFTCPFSLQDDNLKAALGRDTVVATKQMILDVGVDGGLDFGKDKNIDLGRLRAAVGQNVAGAWGIMNLRGAGPLMVQVKHVTYKRNDGSEGKRAEVQRVAKIS